MVYNKINMDNYLEKVKILEKVDYLIKDLKNNKENSNTWVCVEKKLEIYITNIQSSEMLDKIADKNNKEANLIIIKNINTSEKTLKKLMNSEYKDVRKAVADNQYLKNKLHEELLEKFDPSLL